MIRLCNDLIVAWFITWLINYFYNLLCRMAALVRLLMNPKHINVSRCLKTHPGGAEKCYALEKWCRICGKQGHYDRIHHVESNRMREFIRERLVNPDSGLHFLEEDLWAAPPEVIFIEDGESTSANGKIIEDDSASSNSGANSGDCLEEPRDTYCPEPNRTTSVVQGLNLVENLIYDTHEKRQDSKRTNNCEVVTLSSDESVEEVEENQLLKISGEKRMEIIQSAVSKVHVSTCLMITRTFVPAHFAHLFVNPTTIHKYSSTRS